MPVSADTLQMLIAAGLQGEQLLAVVRSIDSDMAVSTAKPNDIVAAKRRAWDRERKARKRESGGIPVESPVDNSGGIPVNAKEAVVEASTPLEITLPSEATSHSPKPSSSSRGTRIPVDFQAKQAERDLALSWSWSDAEIDDELERFRDYWLSRAGKEARKVDWDRTFRNRLKDVNDRRNRAPPQRNSNGGLTPHERQMKAFENEKHERQQRFDDTGPTGVVHRLPVPGAQR